MKLQIIKPHKLNCSNCNWNPFVRWINCNCSFLLLAFCADYNFYTRFGNEILHWNLTIVWCQDSRFQCCFVLVNVPRFHHYLEQKEKANHYAVVICCLLCISSAFHSNFWQIYFNELRKHWKESWIINKCKRNRRE